MSQFRNRQVCRAKRDGQASAAGSWLDSCRPAKEVNPPDRYRIAVVGGGPAGLFVAYGLLNAGHEVTLLEQRGDWREEAADDLRSFNLTLDHFGFAAIGEPVATIIKAFGTRVDGRAIVADDPNDVAPLTHQYGWRPEHSLVSVPRRELLAFFSDLISGHPQLKLQFKASVARPTKQLSSDGKLLWTHNGREYEQEFDLIVFADGNSGVGRDLMGLLGSKADERLEPIGYIKIHISAAEAASMRLPRSKIAFFPRRYGALVIALPNTDGSFSALVEDDFEEIGRPELGEPVFSDVREARAYAEKRLNRRLMSGVPNLLEQLKGKRLSEFRTCKSTHFKSGRVVWIGDAPLSAPPYAGFGTNAAAYQAAMLVTHLQTSGDLMAALSAFEEEAFKIRKPILDVVAAQGNILNNKMNSTFWWLSLRASQLYCRLVKPPPYFRIAFLDNGLAKLSRTRSPSPLTARYPLVTR